MSDNFDRLKQLLSVGATSDECLFYDCNDNTIVIGTNRYQTFQMPLEAKYIKKLTLVYTQKDHIILKKEFEDLDVSNFDNHLLYFILSEEETMKFDEGPVEAQMKVLLEDGSILPSAILKINAVKTIDGLFFENRDKTLLALQATVDLQDVNLISFVDIPAGSSNAYMCKFIFDSTWDLLIKKAKFKDEYNHYVEVDIDDNNLCKIPEEVIANPGNIYIGVNGSSSDVNRPTNWSNSFRVLVGCNK